MPGFVKVKTNLPPVSRTGDFSILPAVLVTVWGTSSSFVQVTRAPIAHAGFYRLT